MLRVVQACVLHVVLEELGGHARRQQGAVVLQRRYKCIGIYVPARVVGGGGWEAGLALKGALGSPQGDCVLYLFETGLTGGRSPRYPVGRRISRPN